MRPQNINWKMIALIVVFLISLGVVLLAGNRIYNLLARAGENTKPENVQITKITANSATVTFTTSSPVTALIDYGTNPSNLTLFASDTQTSDHTVVLSLLTPTTTYYFKIKIGDQTYDNSGVPWTFTTSGTQVPSDNSPTQSPQASGSSGALPKLTTQNSSSSAGETACRSEVARRIGSVKGSANYDARYDVDNNGIINSVDLAKCGK